MKKLLLALMILTLMASNAYAGFNGFLRQYSGITVCVGPFIQMASANTPYNTSLTYDYAFLSKNGAVGASKNDTGAISTSGASGFMYTHLNGTDTNTVGILRMYVQHADTLLVEHTYQVVSPNIFSALYESGTSENSSVYLPVDVKYVSGVTVQADNAGRMDVRNASGIVGSGVTLSSTAILPSGATLAANQDVRNVTAIVGGGVTLSSTAILPSGATLAANQDVRHVQGIVGSGVTLSSTAILPSGATLAANQDVRNVTAIVGSGVTINVSGATRVGIDWADISNKNALVNLSGTTIASGVTVSDIWGAQKKSYNQTGTMGQSVDQMHSGVSIYVSGTTRVGIDWSDISNKTAQVNLSGTTISSGATVYQIWEGTVAEMGAGAPTATPTYKQILNYLYRGWRNLSKTTTSGVSTYADDGVTGLWEFEHSDDGTTYSKGEVKAYTP